MTVFRSNLNSYINLFFAASVEEKKRKILNDRSNKFHPHRWIRMLPRSTAWGSDDQSPRQVSACTWYLAPRGSQAAVRWRSALGWRRGRAIAVDRRHPCRYRDTEMAKRGTPGGCRCRLAVGSAGRRCSARDNLVQDSCSRSPSLSTDLQRRRQQRQRQQRCLAEAYPRIALGAACGTPGVHLKYLVIN